MSQKRQKMAEVLCCGKLGEQYHNFNRTETASNTYHSCGQTQPKNQFNMYQAFQHKFI